MANYIINRSNGSTFNIYDLEQNGPNNISTPRQISDVNLTGGATVNFIKIKSDLTYRFIPGFQFDIIGSGTNDGTYTVSNSVFDGTHTVISILEIMTSAAVPFGNITYSIPNNENETNLLLSGKGILNFGEALNENFLHLLENFANTTAPNIPNIGQLWYKSDSNEMHHYDSTGSWTTDVNLGSGTLSFIDPQHPTDQVNPIIEILGNDSDVGMSIKMLTDPNSSDSILRVLSSADTEVLRVEFNGYVSTTNSIKSLGTTLVNSFANDIQLPNAKGIIALGGASILSGVNGDTWILGTTNPTADIVRFNNSVGTSVLKITQSVIESNIDLVVDPINNILYVDILNQGVGIGKNNPAEALDVVGNITYSNQLLSASGTVLNPGISFNSNNSVGLRLNGSDLLFTSSGIDKLTLKNTGVLTLNTPVYESLVVLDNDIPNKKYVDDNIKNIITPAKLYFYSFSK